MAVLDAEESQEQPAEEVYSVRNSGDLDDDANSRRAAFEVSSS
jgi:hypothetical protein